MENDTALLDIEKCGVEALFMNSKLQLFFWKKKKKRLVHEQTGENCKNHCIKYNTLDFEKS